MVSNAFHSLLQDPGAPAEWLAAATSLLAHLAVMDPEATQQRLSQLWGTLAALLDTTAVASRASVLPRSLQKLQLLHASPPGKRLLSWQETCSAFELPPRFDKSHLYQSQQGTTASHFRRHTIGLELLRSHAAWVTFHAAAWALASSI